ncbi:hypothetical protein QBC42DRAFT_295737 [Cladorrhinum samala]|uniref:Uncharacterized protein n=1 Tax=Cladorrhinum samala TaxID=585594 RepID=A0AAV9HW82_9PEZI|nr:hypothetical protein QBC42DRAFT_295737 [Cladorrhinum samala]
MDITVEAIVAIIALLIAIPPTAFAIARWIQYRRQKRYHRANSLQLYARPQDQVIREWPYTRRQHTINATISIELGETQNIWDPC